jgi:hypothetical protein
MTAPASSRPSAAAPAPASPALRRSRPQRGSRRALFVVATLVASEALAQAMLGRPVMAQLLAPSLWALPALLVVFFSVATRLALMVILPSACAGYLVWRVLGLVKINNYEDL